jgi:hypothetical protein
MSCHSTTMLQPSSLLCNANETSSRRVIRYPTESLTGLMVKGITLRQKSSPKLHQTSYHGNQYKQTINLREILGEALTISTNLGVMDCATVNAMK